MSSTLMAPVGGTKTEFTPAPEGMHVARCYRVIDLGTTYSDRWEKDQHRVMVSWELPDEMHEYEVDGEQHTRPHMVSEFYTLSCHPKSKLRQHLESWYGKRFNDRDLEMAGGFDLAKILGRPAFINVSHDERDGKTYANVASVNPLPKSTECPPPVNEAFVFSLSDFDEGVFEELSDGLQDMVRRSQEWQAMKGDEADETDPPPITDDDIPF